MVAQQKALAITQGKDHALRALAQRRAENADKEKIDNASLYAGSPMTYYCIACDDVTAVLPECHFGAPPKLCKGCRALKELGWLE